MSAGASYSVLLYHGVHAGDLELGGRNSSGKHLPREAFERQMRWLSRHVPLVSMRAIAAAHRGEGRLPDGAVAVTFDDGFRNNRTEAWPVLEAYGVPATIYLATGYIGGGRMIWSDRLESALLGTSAAELALELGGDTRVWKLDGERARIGAFLAVKARAKALPDREKDALVQRVEAALGEGGGGEHPLYRFLDWGEVREMHDSPLIDFGAHTVDHVALTRVPEAEMRRQIDESVAQVSRQLGGACTLFSYPEGQEEDYDASVIAHLVSRGFDHCPTAIEGTNRVGLTDPFHIRRIMVGFEGRPFPFDVEREPRIAR